jgi:hypothetical protein
MSGSSVPPRQLPNLRSLHKSYHRRNSARHIRHLYLGRIDQTLVNATGAGKGQASARVPPRA